MEAALHSLLKIRVIFFIFFSIELDLFFLNDFLSFVCLFLSFMLLFFSLSGTHPRQVLLVSSLSLSLSFSLSLGDVERYEGLLPFFLSLSLSLIARSKKGREKERERD